MYKAALILLAGILVVGGIMYLVGFDETVAVMLTIPLQYIVLLLAIQFAMIIISAAKWRFILRKTKVSFRNLLASTTVGYLVNNLTPFALVGGEPVKAYTLSKSEGISPEKSLASVIVDLFLEIFPIFLLSGLAMFLIILYGIPVEIAVVLGFAALILVVLFFLSITLVTNEGFTLKVIGWFIKVISRVPFLKKRAAYLRSEVDAVCSRFHNAVKEHLLDNTTLFFGTLISLCGWFLRLLRVYVIFRAIGIDISLSVLVIVQAVAVVLSFFPLLPGALGIWEGANIALFVLLGASDGVTPVKATTVTLIDRFLFYWIPSLLGVFGALYLRLNVSRLFEGGIEEAKEDLSEVSKMVES